MSEQTYNQQAAERVARRIPDGFGVDPMTVLVLLQTVIPAFLDCLARNDDTDPDTVFERVKTLYDKNPERLLRRTSRNCRAQARREGTRLSRAQADDMAIAIIVEAIGTEPVFGAALAREVELDYCCLADD
jgi:hypothetical protein